MPESHSRLGDPYFPHTGINTMICANRAGCFVYSRGSPHNHHPSRVSPDALKSAIFNLSPLMAIHKLVPKILQDTKKYLFFGDPTKIGIILID